MKDYTKSELESGRPDEDALDLIDFCLDALYADKIHTIDQDFANNRLTYEELIGTLLKAKDTLIELQKENDEWADAYYYNEIR